MSSIDLTGFNKDYEIVMHNPPSPPSQFVEVYSAEDNRTMLLDTDEIVCMVKQKESRHPYTLIIDCGNDSFQDLYYNNVVDRDNKYLEIKAVMDERSMRGLRK